MKTILIIKKITKTKLNSKTYYNKILILIKKNYNNNENRELKF